MLSEPHAIKSKEAADLMRSVSLVTVDQLIKRDGLGRYVHFPEIKRYQVRIGRRGHRGSAILIDRADVMAWIEGQKRKAEDLSRPLPLPQESALNTYEDIFPELAAMGGYKVIRSLSKNRQFND